MNTACHVKNKQLFLARGSVILDAHVFKVTEMALRLIHHLWQRYWHFCGPPPV